MSTRLVGTIQTGRNGLGQVSQNASIRPGLVRANLNARGTVHDGCAAAPVPYSRDPTGTVGGAMCVESD